MKETPDRWIAADAYERFMGRWSKLIAKEFIDWLNPPPSWKWLEVGCGTGALTRALLNNTHPASVVACDPSPQFVSFARGSLVHPAVTFLIADAGELPGSTAEFDAVVAGLVLNFIPAPLEALRLMMSRLRPGGMLAAYVWDYSDGMQFLRIFWEVVVELDPRASDLDEAQRFPLCHPDALIDLLERAGLGQVESHALEIATPFPDFDSYWLPFLGGTGPGPSYVTSLDPTAREQLRLHLQQRLAPGADGSVRLTARAWAVRGTLETGLQDRAV